MPSNRKKKCAVIIPHLPFYIFDFIFSSRRERRCHDVEKFQKNYLSPLENVFSPTSLGWKKFNSKLYDWVPMIYMTANISINMVIFVRLYNTRKFFVQKSTIYVVNYFPNPLPPSFHLIDPRHFLRYNPSRAVTKRSVAQKLNVFFNIPATRRINHHVLLFFWQ